jgi:hypothetical protein
MGALGLLAACGTTPKEQVGPPQVPRLAQELGCSLALLAS